MRIVFTSGADARYGYHLVNLLGSLNANSPGVFTQVLAYDLGLSAEQRSLLKDVPEVEVRTVPPFVPHYRAAHTYKTWIWRHVDGDILFWIDAGATILRSLAEPVQQVRDRGYFVVGQGHPVRPTIPSDYYDLYAIPEELPDREMISAGILGFAKRSEFFERVIVPTYEDNLIGRNLGFSVGEVDRLNRGINRQDPVIIRDAEFFRPGQTVPNIHFYKNIADPVVSDLNKYAGWRSSHDHPEQMIWHHRRQGNLPYLARAPASLRGRVAASRYRARWWFRMHRKFFMPASYVWKLRKIRAMLRRSPRPDPPPRAST